MMRALVLAWVLSASCATCVPNQVHPLAEEHVYFAAQYYENGDLQQSETRARLAIEYAPDYAEAYNVLGLVEYARGRYEIALEHFKKAIALKSDFAEAHNNIGAVFMSQSQYDLAEDRFLEAIAVDPGYTSARVNLATSLLRRNEFEDAKNQYLRCLEIDPNVCDCRLGLGVVAIQSHDYEESKAQFQRLTEICPKMPEGHYNLCWTYFNLKRCDEAVDACVTALALKPDYLEARKNLTLSYECLALQDKTVAKVLKDVQADPGNAGAHCKLAAIYEDNGMLQKALLEFGNCAELDEKDPLPFYRAARIHDRLLQSQETVSMCQTFLDRLRDVGSGDERDWCVERIRALQLQ